MDFVITLGRSKVYKALSKIFYNLFYELEIPKDSVEILKNFGNIDFSEKIDVKKLRGSLLIKDFPKNLIDVYSEVLKDFYANYGFEVSELPADHIVVELAFMSKLVDKEIYVAQTSSKDLYKIYAIQHRFIKTHLQPLTNSLPEHPFLNFVRSFVAEDAKYIYKCLISKKT